MEGIVDQLEAESPAKLSSSCSSLGNDYKVEIDAIQAELNFMGMDQQSSLEEEPVKEESMIISLPEPFSEQIVVLDNRVKDVGPQTLP